MANTVPVLDLQDKLVILSVKPLGDAVMTIAVARALERIGIRARLRVPAFARGFLAAHGAPLEDDSLMETPSIVIDVGNYLLEDPHAMRISGGCRAEERVDRQGFGHLAQWIGAFVAGQLDLFSLPVNPQDAVLQVCADQLRRGRQLLEERAGCPAGQVVLVVPAAGSLNRVIPPRVYSGFFNQLKSRGLDVTVRLLGPLPKGIDYHPFDTDALAFSLDELPSVLAAAGCVVAADTGPYHIAAAAKAGVESGVADAVGIAVLPDQVILVAGSSNPFTLIYESTQYVLPDMCSCPVIACGAHGYTKPQEHHMLEHRMVFSPDGEQSGCIFPSYATERLAPCMKSIVVDYIAEKVMQVIA